jgi:hypothetical protein
MNQTTKDLLHKWGNVAVMVMGGAQAALAPLQLSIPPAMFGLMMAGFAIGHLALNAIKSEFPE